jgi:MFS family permease
LNVKITHHSRLVDKSPIFYGWIILAAGTFITIMTSPGQTYVVSIFIERFIEDLDLSRSIVSTLYTVGTLAGSLVLPFVGRQIDRFGTRVMAAVVSVLFGAACIYMGTVRNAVMLGAGFIAIRMLGQGSLGLVGKTAINRWWVRRRGFVSGISGLVHSLLGVGAFPNLIHALIPIYGWRRSYQLIGGALMLIAAPVGYIFLRRRPEVYGLAPDGSIDPAPAKGMRADKSTAHAPDHQPQEESWTASEAMRTPTFWVASLGLALLAMLVTGLFFHMVSIFEDNGLPQNVAATVYVPISVATALVNLGSGFLADRLPMRWLLALALFCQTASLVMAQFLQGTTLAFIYGVLLGTTTGLMSIVGSVIWADYYGREHLGSITGITSMILIVGSSLGPMPMGIARDLLGSYTTTLNIAAIFPFLLGMLSLFVGRPEK